MEFDLKDGVKNKRKWRLLMNISEAILGRKSVRAYLDKPVSNDDLEKIIEAGRWAPNAGPFQISVIRNVGLRKKINDSTHKAMLESGIEFAQKRASLPGYQPLYGAPVLILLSAPVEIPNSPFNTALAAENMILQATGLGLGSCFLLSPTRVLDVEYNKELVQEAGIPEGYNLRCAIIVGHAAAENKFALGERKLKGSVNSVD
jgi:nitroreductase